MNRRSLTLAFALAIGLLHRINAAPPGPPVVNVDANGDIAHAAAAVGHRERDAPAHRSAVGPAAPTLLTPLDGASVCDTTPRFAWSPVSGATSYRIQVDESFAFSSPEIDQTTPNTSHTPGTALEPGTTYWHVQAINASGAGEWSSTWGVVVECPPAAPVLSTPADGSSACEARPTFYWNHVSRATSYQIEIDEATDFSSPEIVHTTSDTFFTPGVDLRPGTQHWRVRAANACGMGEWSSARSITILTTPTQPGLSSPFNGDTTSDDTPTFRWDGVSGATWYRVQVDDDSDFDSPEINETTGGTSYTPASGLPDDVYHWRVRAYNECGTGSWSEVWQLTVETACPPPPPPTLSAPPNASDTCSTRPTLDWGSASGATSYRIQADDDPSFDSPQINQTTSDTSYTPASPLAPGTYHWRVRSHSPCGDSSWSPVWSVTILSTPGPPTPLSPSNGDTISDTTPAFSWGNADGATSYHIQVDDDPDFDSPQIDQATSTTSYTPSSGLPEDTHHWRVRASNECGTGPWSAVWQLTIETDCPTPPAPTPSTPANGSSVCHAPPTLSWESASGATSYRVQVDDDPSFSSPPHAEITSNTYYTVESTLPEGTHHWRVQGLNACGAGDWSPGQSFALLSTPAAPTLSTPADESTISSIIPTFRWVEVSEATAYRLQVTKGLSFDSPDIDTTVSYTSYAPDSPLPGSNTYHWHVRADNACGAGPWSETWTFTSPAPSPPGSQVLLPVVTRGYTTNTPRSRRKVVRVSAPLGVTSTSSSTRTPPRPGR